MTAIIVLLITAGASASIMACMTISHIEKTENAIKKRCEK